jgi:hypothetical protein
VKILILAFFALVFSVIYRRKNPVFSIFSQLLRERAIFPTWAAPVSSQRYG